MPNQNDIIFKPFNNAKFKLIFVTCIVVFWLILIFLTNLKNINDEERLLEVTTLIEWWIKTYKQNFGFYPASLYTLDQEGIISPIDILLNKAVWVEFIYSKTEDWYRLTKIKK